MHSLGLWTRVFKTFGRYHVCKILSSTVVCESKLLAQFGALFSVNHSCSNDRNIKMLVGNIRNVANNSSPENLTTWTNNSRLQQLVLRINADINRLRRVFKSDIQHLLQDLKMEDSPQDKQKIGLLLLQCCGNLLPDEHPSFRLNLVHEVWKTLHTLAVPLSVEHYNMLLQSYIENGQKIQAPEFLKNMGNVKPNETTYLNLLSCVCERGDIKQAIDVISWMKSENLPVNEAVFNSLLMGHSRGGDLASAISVLEIMQTAQVPPTVDTYTALMKAYVENGDMAGVQKVYEKATGANISLNELYMMDIVKSAAISGNVMLIPQILKLMPEGSLDLSPVVINMAVHLVHLGYEHGAFHILCAVPKDSGFDPKDDASFGSFVLREMVKARTPALNIIDISDLLAASGRNRSALHKAAEIALIMAHTELALILLKALKDRGAPLRPHYFWPIFLSLSKQDGEKGMVMVLNHMIHLEVDVDFDTLVDYIIPHTSCVEPESLIRKLQAHGLQVSKLLTPVIMVLLKENKVKAALQLCEKFKSNLDLDRLLHPLVHAFESTGDITSTVKLLKFMIAASRDQADWGGQFILEVLFSKKNGRKNVHKILQEYHQEGVHISSFAGEILLNYAAQIGSSDDYRKQLQTILDSLINSELTMSSAELFNQQIPHPRDMSREELECHLVELKSKNLNTRGVLRRLFQLHCREGNIKKVLEIKKELEDAGHEFSAGMQASLFDLHVRLGHLDDAEKALVELNQTAPGFHLDDHKIVDFATLLAAHNNYRGAVAILEKHAGFHKVKGGPGIVRNCWKLLQAIAEKGEPQRVKHMLELLVTLRYCNISNILLGPVIRAHLVLGSLQGAVKEYQHCVSKYNKTPLQLELLCQIVSAENDNGGAASLLEQVIEATKRVYGTDSSNVAVAVALAQTGKTKQLQKLIMNSPSFLKPPLLMVRCKRLADEGQLRALENIARVSKGIQNFDSSALYMLLLKVYSQHGDCDGALSLWTSLQEQDIQPSNEFLNTLASLLKSNKRDIPFVVPDDNPRKQFHID